MTCIVRSTLGQDGNSKRDTSSDVLGAYGRGTSVLTRPMANTTSRAFGLAGRVRGVSTAGLMINLRCA